MRFAAVASTSRLAPRQLLIAKSSTSRLRGLSLSFTVAAWSRRRFFSGPRRKTKSSGNPSTTNVASTRTCSPAFDSTATLIACLLNAASSVVVRRVSLGFGFGLWSGFAAASAAIVAPPAIAAIAITAAALGRKAVISEIVPFVHRSR